MSELESGARIIVGVLALVVFIAVMWLLAYFAGAPGRERQAHANQVAAEARAASAADAVAAVSAHATSDTLTDATTRSNDAAIHAAPGASLPVGPGVGDAGRRALCLRNAYRDLPACQRLLQAHP